MKYIYSLLLTLCVMSAATAQQKVISLKECLEIGLQQNYDILIVRNDERISSNNATAANAGMLPTLDLSSGYSGVANRTATTPFEGEKTIDNAAYNQTVPCLWWPLWATPTQANPPCLII
ncbi:MAG: TolC family protein [Alistipes sp.]|nr:TolC family protein [Alistipes sp.]